MLQSTSVPLTFVSSAAFWCKVFHPASSSPALSHEVAPDVMTLIGHAGVSLMIFESGMHFDFSQLRVVGPKALVFATCGTGLPIALAIASQGLVLHSDSVFLLRPVVISTS